MYKNIIHVVVVVALVLVSMSVARAEGGERVLYVGNEKGVCDKIGPFVDVCREREEDKGADGMAAIYKYLSYTEDKKDFAVVVDETSFKERRYNPAGLLITIGMATVGGGAFQGAMIGNKNPFGKEVSRGGDSGFSITVNGDETEERCGDIPYPECRARMLEEIKRRWPKKVK